MHPFYRKENLINLSIPDSLMGHIDFEGFEILPDERLFVVKASYNPLIVTPELDISDICLLSVSKHTDRRTYVRVDGIPSVLFYDLLPS